MLEMFYSLLNLEIKTIVAVLFWGNLTSLLLIVFYRLSSKSVRNQKLSKYYSLAKLCQALAYFCFFFRYTLPDAISVNLGNSFLLMGFYMEANAMLLILHEYHRKTYIILQVACAAGVIIFNGLEIFWPNPGIRVFASSICIFLILVFPSIKMITCANIGRFNRIIGIFYLVFIVLLLPRSIYAFSNHISILSNSFIQSLTFITLVMLMVFGLSAYVLLMKERSDKVISHLAVTDPLTGLPNRRSFMDMAEAVFERHKAGRAPLSVLFIDIDYFKKINDAYGHTFGDEVLVAMGNVIRTSLRDRDLFCRYGGEEFVILLPEATFEKAKLVTQRIVNSIAETTFQKHPEFSFTVSIGVMSGIPAHNEALSVYLDKADKALYHAKNTGRNKVDEYNPDYEL
jgi:diguanylate cyclase (GGDEF)-like protein